MLIVAAFAGQTAPPKVTALPALEAGVEKTLPPGTSIDLVLQTLLDASKAVVDDRFEAIAVTANIPPESMQPIAAATARGFLSSVRRPGKSRSSLTLSFEEWHAGPKPQRLRASVFQVFRGPKPDESEGQATAALYKGLQPFAGLLVDVPGTITSVDGKEVRLPPGTVLRVRLDQPITIRLPGLQAPAASR